MQLEYLKSQYDCRLDSYKVFAESLQHKISQLLDDAGLRIHSIRYRVKSWNSFSNKVRLKQYSDPFTQCQDVVGCRIITLFTHQLEHVVSLMMRNFEIVNHTTKGGKSDRFSYKGYHVVVRSGDLLGEVQIRSILQDAWAEIEHYLNYKQIGVDEQGLRKINALSALFEIADDQFSSLYIHHQQLREQQQERLDDTLTPMRLYHYSKKRFSDAWKHNPDGRLDSLVSYEGLVESCSKVGVHTVRQLDEVYEKVKHLLQNEEQLHIKDVLNNAHQWPGLYTQVSTTGMFYLPPVRIARMIALWRTL